MGLSNGPRRAVCTEHYGVKANETLHPSRHKTLSLSLSCEHPRRALVELRPRRRKAPWRRLQISSEVSATSERQNPIQLSEPLYTPADEDFSLTDASNENASSRTSAVVLTIRAPIADSGSIGRRVCAKQRNVMGGLAGLTVLSHQTVGCIGDGFDQAAQEAEGGQEALGAELVAQLDREGATSHN